MTHKEAFDVLESMLIRAVQVNLEHKELAMADQFQLLVDFCNGLRQRIKDDNSNIISFKTSEN
jgi:hypothetical protein